MVGQPLWSPVREHPIGERDAEVSATTDRQLSSFEEVFPDRAAASRLRDAAPTLFATASEFWRVPLEAGYLSPRLCELLLLAMHGTPTAVNEEGLGRHVDRARSAGATDADIADVLFTISAVANHALYFSVPILEEELRAAGIDDDADRPLPGDYESTKRDFVSARGFWNADRERFARLMPAYFKVLNGMSTDSWKNGSLSAKEREFVCIAIDCTVTHNYEPGLRLHIRNALGRGATRDEILQIFQLAALVGLEGYVLGAQTLFPGPDSTTRSQQ